MNRYLKSIGGVGLVALLGVTMVTSVVNAQTNGSPGTAVSSEKTSKRDQFLSALASNLDVSVETLQGAFQQTVDEVGFGPGPFGGRFRGMIQDRIDDRHERVIEHIDLSDGAAFLGITEDELRAELQSGKTPLEIAEEHGKTIDEIRAFLIQQATARIDERLQAASDAPAGSDSADPAEEGTTISEATEVPAAPALRRRQPRNEVFQPPSFPASGWHCCHPDVR